MGPSPRYSREIRKLANAFVPDATPSGWLLASTLWAVERFRRKHGGVWVGGATMGASFSGTP
jgi:hypothetical protein